MEIDPAKLDEFTKAYIKCALWSSNDDSDEETGGEPLDENYTVDDFDEESLRSIMVDCKKFQHVWGKFIRHESRAKAGHDFWLTRNHHGAGFWDGEWPETGDILSRASDSFGASDIYVGDDYKLYT